MCIWPFKNKQTKNLVQAELLSLCLFIFVIGYLFWFITAATSLESEELYIILPEGKSAEV